MPTPLTLPDAVKTPVDATSDPSSPLSSVNDAGTTIDPLPSAWNVSGVVETMPSVIVTCTIGFCGWIVSDVICVGPVSPNGFVSPTVVSCTLWPSFACASTPPSKTELSSLPQPASHAPNAKLAATITAPARRCIIESPFSV